MLDASIVEADRGEVADGAGVVQSGINAPAFGIDVGARERTQRLARDVAIRRRRMLADGTDVLALERLLERDPVPPALLDRHAVHLPERRRVVRLRAGCP